jgi:hypothetical protein
MHGALLNRERHRLRVRNDPGSAVHRFPVHRVRDTMDLNEQSHSRDAPAHPSYATPLSELVTTGHSRSQNGVLQTPMPVVHAELRQANAGGSIRKRRFGTDDERKNERKYRRRNADRRKALLPGRTGPAAPQA